MISGGVGSVWGSAPAVARQRFTSSADIANGLLTRRGRYACLIAVPKGIASDVPSLKEADAAMTKLSRYVLPPHPATGGRVPESGYRGVGFHASSGVKPWRAKINVYKRDGRSKKKLVGDVVDGVLQPKIFTVTLGTYKNADDAARAVDRARLGLAAGNSELLAMVRETLNFPADQEVLKTMLLDDPLERHKPRNPNAPRRIVGGPDEPHHGTAHGYNNLGCRCERCTERKRLISAFEREARRREHADRVTQRVPINGPVLRELRETLRFSQRQVEDAVGVGPMYVQKLEAGRQVRTVTPDVADRLDAFFREELKEFGAWHAKQIDARVSDLFTEATLVPAV